MVNKAVVNAFCINLILFHRKIVCGCDGGEFGPVMGLCFIL